MSIPGLVSSSVEGQSASIATQNASVQFIPSVNYQPSSPVVSSYPAGQGLATLNVAYPDSAAYQSSTYPASSSTSSSSLLPYVLLAAAGVAAWYFLARKK